MKFENTRVMNFDGALRGMRNPKESWAKSDSYFDKNGNYVIGPNDMKLAQTLIKAGPEHRKFLRQIFVCVDITAAIFWFKEWETYKIGTTSNSTSTMHKLTSKPITRESFEMGDFCEDLYVQKVDQSGVTEAGKERNFKAHWHMDSFVDSLIEHLEDLRQDYISYQNAAKTTTNAETLKCLENRMYCLWKELVRWLPESWLQTRTVTMNYENLLSICSQRRFHRLNEWSGKRDSTKPNFISWARTLPYAQEFIFPDELKE